MRQGQGELRHWVVAGGDSTEHLEGVWEKDFLIMKAFPVQTADSGEPEVRAEARWWAGGRGVRNRGPGSHTCSKGLLFCTPLAPTNTQLSRKARSFTFLLPRSLKSFLVSSFILPHTRKSLK